jgi:hypothetical protein
MIGYAIYGEATALGSRLLHDQRKGCLGASDWKCDWVNFKTCHCLKINSGLTSSFLMQSVQVPSSRLFIGNLHTRTEDLCPRRQHRTKETKSIIYSEPRRALQMRRDNAWAAGMMWSYLLISLFGSNQPKAERHAVLTHLEKVSDILAERGVFVVYDGWNRRAVERRPRGPGNMEYMASYRMMLVR